MSQDSTLRDGKPRWYYSELRQVGKDFDTVEMVEQFDRFQGNTDERSLETVERLAIGDGSVFVDLGCGPGSHVIAAARLGARTHAVDVSEKMLARVGERAAREGLSTVSTHRAGFLTYEHRGEPVDAILSITALHHLPDFWKAIGLQRVRQLLKPHGVFLLVDAIFTFDDADYEGKVNAWVDRGKPVGEGFTREDYETHVRDEYSTYGWIVEGLLERAGFEIRERRKHRRASAPSTCALRVLDPVSASGFP